MKSLGQLGPAIRAMLLLTVLLGLAYPLAVTGVAQVAFPGRADGSLVRVHGRLVGSSLVGQSFGTRAGYFWSRPSAAGAQGYDPQATGASNLALDNPVLVKAVRMRQDQVARADGVARSDVPPDAVLASGSGLDPQISPAYAALQVPRVARARGLSEAQVRVLVHEHTKGRTLGFLGEPRVDVLALNLALDRARP
jgi:potassium-transporting ATPase KdpC subunit